jgi:hypothetical protein
VLEDKGRLGAGFRKACGVRHLRREHLKVKAPAIVRKAGDVALDHGIGAEIRPRRKAIKRVLVPMQLHAHAAYEVIALQAVELWTHVVH